MLIATQSGGQLIPQTPSKPASLCAPLAEVLGSIGRPCFYQTLANQLSAMLNCGRYLVMRYSEFAKPAFLVNSFMPSAVQDLYLDDLYRIDPLYGMVRQGRQSNVSTLRAVRRESNDTEYCDALFRYACIYDELAIMLPLFGGLVIAMCFDNESEQFDGASVALAMDVYPAIQQANRLHLERSLPGGGYGLLDCHSTAVMVTTADGELVYKNGAWITAENSALRTEIDGYIRSDFTRRVVNVGDSVLHGHRLDSDNPVWPNGNIFVIEGQRAASIGVDFSTIFSAVAHHYRLSPRERDLFGMALQGCDSRSIARRLGLSVGTVKNYKRRLYAKLNIRCEREIVSLLMKFLAGSAVDAGTDVRARPRSVNSEI